MFDHLKLTKKHKRRSYIENETHLRKTCKLKLRINMHVDALQFNRVSHSVFFYFRMLFGEFRFMFQQLAMHERCPGFIRNIISSFIRFISKLAPQVPPANTSTTN